MGLLKGGKSPSSEALLPVDAREKTASGATSTTDNQQRPSLANKMACVRRTIMVLLLCMLVLFGIASGFQAVPCRRGAADQQPPVETSDPSAFSTALKSASPASLHDLLHRFLPERFRDGVFPSDHQAIEAVHREDAALDTTILQLAKRDETNSTVSSDSPTPTPTKTVTETETSEPPSETTPSTTASPSSSSSSEAPPSTTSVPPVTSSSSRSPTPTSTPSSSSPLPGTSFSSSETTSSSTSPTSSSSGETTSSRTSSTSSSSGEPTLSSTSFSSSSSAEPGSSSSSAPQTSPSSSIPGETTLTTSTIPPSSTTTPPRTSRQVTHTLTSTSPDGAVVTITATTWVPVDGAETPAPASTTHGNPTLQNFAARSRGSGSVLAGVVGLAMLLAVA